MVFEILKKNKRDEIMNNLAVEEGLETFVSKPKKIRQFLTPVEDLRSETAKTVLVGGFKGGVGKTTFAQNLAGFLTTKNKKVLVISLDPQEDLKLISKKGRANVLVDVFERVSEKGYDFWELPMAFGDVFDRKEKYSFNIATMKETDVSRTRTAVEKIERGIGNGELENQKYDFGGFEEKWVLPILHFFTQGFGYDYIIIDTPPSPEWFLTEPFMIASDFVIPVTAMDEASFLGLKNFTNVVKKAKKKNPSLKLPVVCFSMEGQSKRKSAVKGSARAKTRIKGRIYGLLGTLGEENIRIFNLYKTQCYNTDKIKEEILPFRNVGSTKIKKEYFFLVDFLEKTTKGGRV